jgi:hypothetical protein
MMKVKCEFCKAVFDDVQVALAHLPEHNPKPAPRKSGESLFKVGWKKDGTIRQPRGDK